MKGDKTVEKLVKFYEKQVFKDAKKRKGYNKIWTIDKDFLTDYDYDETIKDALSTLIKHKKIKVM